jgi:hypothetical protein
MQLVIQNTLGEVTGSLVSPSREVEIQLTAQDIFKLSGDPRGVQISAIEGQLWVTQQGDPSDYLLHPGEKVKISRQGTVLVQSIPNRRARMALATVSP